jgi:hypothetical protein
MVGWPALVTLADFRPGATQQIVEEHDDEEAERQLHRPVR